MICSTESHRRSSKPGPRAPSPWARPRGVQLERRQSAVFSGRHTRRDSTTRTVGRQNSCPWTGQTDAGRRPIARGRPTLLTQGAEGSHRERGRAARIRHQAGWARISRPGPRARHVVRGTVCCEFLLDNTVVSVGLANVQSDLHAGVTSLQWVVNGYALTFASFMLVAGMLGDTFGRKRIMFIGVAIFCGGSVVAATASNVDWLIAGRVIMGIGAAASEPGTLSIIRTSTPIAKLWPTRWAYGPRCRAWRWPWAPSSGASWSASRAGVPSSGSIWDSVPSRSSWLPLPFPSTSDRQGRRVDVLGFIFGALSWAASPSP